MRPIATLTETEHDLGPLEKQWGAYPHEENCFCNFSTTGVVTMSSMVLLQVAETWSYLFRRLRERAILVLSSASTAES